MILLVEDNPHDVLMTRRAFRKAGLDVPLFAVDDGEAAVAYLAGADPYADRNAHPWPALVLLDLKLPRLSGIEVLRWMRAERRLDGLPVVVLTSSTEDEDIVEAYRAGANSYLGKPVAFDELTALMRTLHLYWMRHNLCGGRLPAGPAG